MRQGEEIIMLNLLLGDIELEMFVDDLLVDCKDENEVNCLAEKLIKAINNAKTQRLEVLDIMKKKKTEIKEMWKIGDVAGNHEYYQDETSAKNRLYERIKTDFGDSVEFQVLKNDVNAILEEFSDVFFIAKVIVSR